MLSNSRTGILPVSFVLNWTGWKPTGEFLGNFAYNQRIALFWSGLLGLIGIKLNLQKIIVEKLKLCLGCMA
jgi:hypothetical protein